MIEIRRLTGAGGSFQGQRSGDVGWRYLLLLAGAQNVKPDRKVRRFVSEAVGVTDVSAEKAATLMLEAAEHMNVEPRALDHVVWRFKSPRAESPT